MQGKRRKEVVGHMGKQGGSPRALLAVPLRSQHIGQPVFTSFNGPVLDGAAVVGKREVLIFMAESVLLSRLWITQMAVWNHDCT